MSGVYRFNNASETTDCDSLKPASVVSNSASILGADGSELAKCVIRKELGRSFRAEKETADESQQSPAIRRWNG